MTILREGDVCAMLMAEYFQHISLDTKCTNKHFTLIYYIKVNCLQIQPVIFKVTCNLIIIMSSTLDNVNKYSTYVCTETFRCSI